MDILEEARLEARRAVARAEQERERQFAAWRDETAEHLITQLEKVFGQRFVARERLLMGEADAYLSMSEAEAAVNWGFALRYSRGDRKQWPWLAILCDLCDQPVRLVTKAGMQQQTPRTLIELARLAERDLVIEEHRTSVAKCPASWQTLRLAD